MQKFTVKLEHIKDISNILAQKMNLDMIYF